MLEELNVIAERDPIWYESLMKYDINNIILYAVRNNQELVGFIWAINFDISRKEIIKEIFEVCSFVIWLMSVCTSTSRNTTDCIPKRTDADRNGQSQIVTENIAAALSYDAEPVNIIQ